MIIITGKITTHYISGIMLLSVIFYVHAEPINHLQEQEKARYDYQHQKIKDNYIRGESGKNNEQGRSEINLPDEKECFYIAKVELQNEQELPVWLPLKKIAGEMTGKCIGVNGVKIISSAIQNRIIESGYITTRVVIPQQNIKSGIVVLRIVPGITGKMIIQQQGKGHSYLTSSFPVKQGKLLDLRDLEQGIENTQRVPGVSTKVQLYPGDAPGETDIFITRQQHAFWRVGAWFDDSGSQSTGRYQGGVLLYLDNLASLNDLFYLSAGSDLDGSRSHNSRNMSTYYSFPWQYWTFDLYAGQNRYLQTIYTDDMNLDYRGKSRRLSLQVSRVVHRSNKQRTTVSLQLIKRDSSYHLNDVEMVLQKRNLKNWMAELNYQYYFTHSLIDSTLSYQQQINRFKEGEYGGVSPLGRVFGLEISTSTPFNLLGKRMTHSATFRQQYTPDRLISQDQFSIGNRWTVRGFDGEVNLMSDNGFYLRNEISFDPLLNNQRIYLAIDHGRIRHGQQNENSKVLTGMVTGIRGTFNRIGYHLFAGVPLQKPTDFSTSHLTSGFTLRWQF